MRPTVGREMLLNAGWSYREQVDARGHGRDLLSYLAETYRHSSRDDWSDRLRRQEVEIDGAPATAESTLRQGQILVWHRPPWNEGAAPAAYSVVYEDESVVAVNKPVGLPTMPGGGFLERTLLALVRSTYPDALPVHRLGRHTSGVVLFARTTQAASIVARAWRNHEVRKLYRALGAGVPAWDRLEIRVPIGPVPHPILGSVHAASPNGRSSHTTALVLERRGDATIFEVGIATGRPHQIRIHLAFAGHPLIGDPLYAPGGRPRALDPGLPGDGGYHLHAERLRLIHPMSRQVLELHAPPPPELRTSAQPSLRQEP